MHLAVRLRGPGGDSATNGPGPLRRYAGTLYRSERETVPGTRADESDVAAAAAMLSRSPTAKLAELAAELRDAHISGPGLYSWWVDDPGGAHLAAGLGTPVESGLIYAGQTGATRWPSGKRVATDLRDRICGHHMRGRIRGSTFRLTLAAALAGRLGLRVAGPKRLAGAGEQALSDWIDEHLSLGVYPFRDRDRLADLEGRVLDLLDPPLNLEGRGPSAIRRALSAQRRALS